MDFSNGGSGEGIFETILDVVRSIPYGHVATYGQIAEKVDCTNETLEEFKEYTLRRLDSLGESSSVSYFKYFHESKIMFLVF